MGIGIPHQDPSQPFDPVKGEHVNKIKEAFVEKEEEEEELL
jgi:hypothetical protein